MTQRVTAAASRITGTDTSVTQDHASKPGMITSAFDKEGDDDVILKNQPSPRPKDAATLILVRRDASRPRVLLGKRSGGHVFMPDKYVFPGGRVDPGDSRAVSWCELRPEVEDKLRIQARRQPRAFALTAIRETFEETGLLVARPAEMPSSAPKGWARFHELDAAPHLSPLTFIGRAITPPYRPRRFDARKLATDLCLFLRTVGCDSAIEPGARCSRYVPRDAHDPASGRAPPRTGKTTRIPSYGLRSRKQHAARVRPQDRVLGWVVRRLRPRARA